MITKIELGSFNRDTDSPIMLKEKIESDGSPSLRIYQRKDIDSITSFKDKIKTMMKYGIEDFCMKHETFRPLLQSVGVKRINRLQTDNPNSAQDLFQSLRSEARTGTVAQKTEGKLKEILENYGLPKDYQIDFYAGKYKTEDFFSDLNRFLSSDNNFSKKDLFFLRSIESVFISKEISSNATIKIYDELIKNIKKSLDNHFKKQTQLIATQSNKSTNSSDTHFSGSITTDINNLYKEIMEKLNEIENEIKQRSITPKDEDIKNNLLSSIEYVVGDSEGSDTWAGSDAQKKATEIRATLNILFSTSWWISEERKMESLKKVQDFFKVDTSFMPEAVINRIYPEQKSVSVSPLSNPHRRTTDDDTTLESLGKIQNFSENNQGLLSGAVTHRIYTDRKLKTSSSTSDPQRKTTEDDD